MQLIRIFHRVFFPGGFAVLCEKEQGGFPADASSFDLSKADGSQSVQIHAPSASYLFLCFVHAS
jgi:hypothetical protein